MFTDPAYHPGWSFPTYTGGTKMAVPQPDKHYSHIIVGAGSAGCVLAGRLSEDPNASVLLVEAGPSDRHPQIQVPAAFTRTWHTRFDWAYHTVPQHLCADREMYWPRGRVLGGSSSINAMVYIRGSADDFDGWARDGNAGWSYRDVLPYFRRSEDNSRGADEWHGVGGPLGVCDPRSPHPWSEAFVAAGAAAGLGRNPDFNGATQRGFGVYQVTQRDGARCSTARAYLAPARGRGNLDVLTDALVTRLLFDGTRCVGIEFVRQRRGVADRSVTYSCYGDEVIVSGGTVNSPQLLMLSGIGPADHLRELGIAVRQDLPVGIGLQDHPMVQVGFRSRSGGSLLGAESPRQALNYFLRRRGPWTSNVSEAAGFVRTDETDAPPDIQFNFQPALIAGHEQPTEHGLSIGVVLIDVASTGRIRLRSTDPAEPPLIDPNYYAEPSDLRSAVRGVRIARRVAQCVPLAGILAREDWVGADARTDDEIGRAVARSAETLFHPTSTCRMGVGADAVVDPELRVRGIEGLRVVDASVMPRVPRGNTNAPTIMIAERAVDLIRASGGHRHRQHQVSPAD